MKNSKKHCEEYLAKWIIEDIFDYGIFEKSEKPDLQNKNYGIEVTSALSPLFHKSEGDLQNYLENLTEQNYKKAEKSKKKLYANQIVIPNNYDGIIVRNMNFTDKYLLQLLEESITKKVKKLEGYNNFNQMGLFIYSIINIENNIKEIINLLKKYKKKNNKMYDFVFIYERNANGKLFWMDLNQNEYDIKEIDDTKYFPK